MGIGMPNNISVIILTKDCEETLEETLKSVRWVDEIIIIDQNSKDATISIAKKYTNAIFQESNERFDVRRNSGMAKASNPWIMYIDADEIVTPALQKEIMVVCNSEVPKNFEIVRENYFLGTKMYPDTMQRIFHKKTLKEWQGKVHETPLYEGEMITLKNKLLHHTHRSITSMLEKTNHWSAIEAQLRFEAKHPAIKPWRVIRIALTEMYHQFVNKKVYRFGIRGWIEGWFQVIDKIIVFVKLWELQQR